MMDDSTLLEAIDLAALPALSLFVVGERTYGVRDVVCAVALSGAFAAEVERARDRVAALATLEQQGEPPARAERARAVAQWRASMGLVSAEDAERWLRPRGLDAAALFAYAARSVAEARVPPDEAIPAPAPLVAAALYAELAFSGALARLAQEASRCAALEATWRSAGARTPPAERVSERARALLDRPLGIAGDPDVPRLLLAEQAALFALTAAPLLEERRLLMALDARRLDLGRARVAQIAFDTPGAAREARLCVEHDGEALEALAARLGLACQDHTAWVDELPPAIARAVVSAVPGQLLGPVELAGRHAVLRVDDRREPALEDPEVRARVEAHVLAGVIDGVRAAEVRWLAWSPDR